MNKSIKVTSAPLSKRLLASFLDFLTVFILGLLFVVIGIFAFVKPLSNYDQNKSYAAQVENAYDLNMPRGLEYKEYESSIKNFYERFDDEIIKFYKDNYDINGGIVHLYNASVLDLPFNPTSAEHDNEYFTYRQNSDGTYNVMQYGKIKDIYFPNEPEKQNVNFKRNMSDFFYNKHLALKNLMTFIDPNYDEAINDNLGLEGMTRGISFAIATIVIYMIIPFVNKSRSTIFELVFGFGHANYTNGYKVSWWKILLRGVCYFIIPIIAITFASSYKLWIVAIFPLFISLLLMMFTSSNRDLADLILSMITIDKSESLLFKDKKEEIEYEDSDEYKVIEDEDFLNRLSSIDSFNLNESRDEELKQDHNKKEK